VIRQAPFRLSFPPLDFSRATRDPEISRELTFPSFETDSPVNLDADWAPHAAPEGVTQRRDDTPLASNR
jgi:hypothetical protein